MKKILFILFIFIILLVYFAEPITKYAICKILSSKDIKVKELHLGWDRNGLNIKKLNIEKLNIEKSSDFEAINIQGSNLLIDFNIYELKHNTIIDYLSMQYSQCQIEQLDKKENSNEILLQRFFEFGLNKFNIKEGRLELNNCKNKALISFSSNIEIVDSLKAKLIVSGHIQLSESSLIFASSDFTIKSHISSQSLNYNIDINNIDSNLGNTSKKIPLQIVDGIVQISGVTNKAQKSDITIKYIDGSILINNIMLKTILSNNEIYWMKDEVTVKSRTKINSIGEPLNASNIEIEANYDSNMDKPIYLNKMQLLLADGNVYVEPLNFNLTDNIKTKIRLNNVDLEKLVSDANIDGLSVIGRIDGWVNIKYDHNKLFLTNGLLKSSDKGGILKYTPKNKVVLSNFAIYTKLPPEYWENFIYKNIEVDIENHLSKTVLYLKIYGSNPEFFNNRQFNLNSKISLPISSLLKSWWIGEEIGLETLKTVKNY